MVDPSGHAELARLHEVTVAEGDQLASVKVLSAAEELLAVARIIDVLELQIAARCQHADAELRLVRALRAGSRDTIAAGQGAAAAQAESERVCAEGDRELAQIDEATARRFDSIVVQYGRWADAADAEFYARLRAE